MDLRFSLLLMPFTMVFHFGHDTYLTDGSKLCPGSGTVARLVGWLVGWLGWLVGVRFCHSRSSIAHRSIWTSHI